MKAAKIIIISLFMGGCVSVNLGPKKVEHASGVVAVAPAAPFVKTPSESVDELWRNNKNGNAISYLSDCSDQSDPPLASIESGVLSGLYPYSYITQKDIIYQNRGARRVQIKGQVDGVPSLVDLVIFKRNSCIYILSFAGVEEHHAENMSAFEGFLQRFKAP